MKKLFVILGILVVLFVGAVFTAPFWVPTETIKSQLTTQVESETGRKLSVDGDLSLSLLPNLAVKMTDVRFDNVPGSNVRDMVAMDELSVVLKILPLLSKTVEVSEFVLKDPTIHLEVDAEGRPNWEMATSTPTAQPAESESTSEAGSLPIAELKLGDIRLDNGSLTYVDHAAGTEEKIEAINLTISLADIQSPLGILGSLDYKGETVELDLDLDNPRAVLDGAQTPLKLGIESDKVQLGFTGDLINQASPSAAGDIDLSVPSIKELAAWLAEPVDMPEGALEALTISGKLNGSAARVAFTDATISLDKMTGQGEVSADLTGAVPKVTGRLDLGAVDLNPYMSTATEAEDGETVGGATTDASSTDGESTDWSDEPIAMPALDALDLSFELTLNALTFQELKLDRTVLAMAMADNALTAELKEFGLYEGKGAGSLALKVTGDQLALEQNFNLTGLAALPFLSDAADFDRLEGTANAEFAIATTGNSERSLVQNLNGKGNVVFANGAISGINLAAMVRNASSAFLSADANEARKTDFAELSGSFTISDGMLSNNDLQLLAPALRVSGAGKVDLPAKTVDYRVDPKAAATLEGQGSETDVSGLLVPVIVTGPFDDLSYKPDLSNIVNQALEDPDALKEQVKSLGGSGKDIKKQLKSINKDDAKELLDGLTNGEEDATDSPAGSLLKNFLK